MALSRINLFPNIADSEADLLSLVADYYTAYAVDMHWPADRFANESDPNVVLAAAAEALGKGIGVTRAFYAEVDAIKDTVHIAIDWCDGVPSRVGTYPFAIQSGPVQRMLREGVTVIEDVDSVEVDRDLAAINKANETYAWIAMPLMEGNRPIALVGVTNNTPRSFSEADVLFVREVANRTWHALVHVRTLARLRESQEAMDARAQHEQFFRAVGDEISRDRDDATILVKIGAMLGRYLGVEDAAFLEPQSGDPTHLLLYRPVVDPAFDRHFQTITLPPHKAAWRAAAEAGKPVVVSGARSSGAATLWGAPSAIVASVREDDHAALILSIESAEPRSWSEADIRLAQDLVEMGWSASRRVRAESALAERERNQALLLDWADAVRDIDGPEAAIEATLVRLERAFGDVATSFSEYSEDGGHLRHIRIWQDGRLQRVEGTFDTAALGALPPLDTGSSGTVVITDAANDPHLSVKARTFYQEFGIAAALIAPIVDQGRTVALLSMQSERPRRWKTNEKQLMRDLADRLWSLLLRLRAENELAQREADQAFLIEWSDAIRDTVDPENIIAQTLAYLTRRFPGAIACLDELNDAAKAFERSWCWQDGALHRSASRMTLRDLDAASIRDCLAGRTVALNSAAPSDLPPTYAKRGAGALLATPIVSGGRTMATLTLHTHNSRTWSKSDQRVVHELAERVWSSLDRARGQVALTQSRTALAQAERMAALGAVLGGISHELNNPLAVVTAQAQLIALLAEDTDLADRANRVHEAGERCARIIRNFAAVARQAPPDRRREVLGDIVERAVRQVDRPDDVTIEYQTGTATPLVMVDADQIHQVLVNLLVNAQQALAQRPRPARRVSLRIQRAGPMVHVDVADDGPGISPDIRTRIFEPFFTTKTVGEGTGMGLSLAKGVAELHGGALTLLPTDHGATFRLVLPISG